MRFDHHQQTVLIIGAGVVGLTAANALMAQGYTVRLLDRHAQALDNTTSSVCHPPFNQPVFPVQRPTHVSALPQPPLPMPAFERVSACHARTLALWESLGITLPQETLKATPFYQMQVWDSTTGARVQFDASDHAMPYLGHIVSHTAVRRNLLMQFRQAGGHCVAPCDLQGLATLPTGKVQVTDTVGQSWEADLLIGADGPHSWVRKTAGIAYDRWAYEQHAVVCTLACTYAHNYTAYQAFTDKGPLALLPLNGGRHVSLVWSVPIAYATDLMHMPPDTFAHTVSTAFMENETNRASQQQHSARLGPFVLASERACFPLVLRHACTYTRPGIALVGDAAHTFHPLAGQGLNMGLADVAALQQTIQAARRRQRAIADPLYLQRYSRQRRAQMWPMIALMEGLKRGYAASSHTAAQARAWGMYCVQKSAILKRFCVGYAA